MQKLFAETGLVCLQEKIVWNKGDAEECQDADEESDSQPRREQLNDEVDDEADSGEDDEVDGEADAREDLNDEVDGEVEVARHIDPRCHEGLHGALQER